MAAFVSIACLAGVAAAAQQGAEQRFSAAESAFAAGDATAAVRMLDELVADYPADRYPHEPWRAAALVRAGEIELAVGDAEEATRRMVVALDAEAPSSWTSRARVGLATALMWQGRWPEAADLLQDAVDALAAADASADLLAAAVASERLTLLHRLWLRPAAGEQPWQRSGRLEIGVTLDRPVGVAASGNGLLISDEGRDVLVFRDTSGNAATFPLQDGHKPWWSPAGEAYVAARAVVQAPLSGASMPFSWIDRGRQRQVEDIRAGLRTPTGAWVLLDDGTDGVLRFASDGTYDGALDVRGGTPVDVERGPRGRLFVLERDRREVMVFDAAGALQGGFAIDGWRRPQALAVDAIGHVYVLDRDLERIDVFDPDGGVLWTLGPTLPGGVTFDDPRDIAVDGSGRILVADRGFGVVLVIE